MKEGATNMLSAFKNFGVTFIIALVIFGISAYFATTFVTNTMSSIMSSEKEQLDDIFDHNDEEGMQPGDQPGNVIDPGRQIEGESFSFLVVISDYRPDLYGDYMTTDAQTLNEKAWSLTDQYEAVGYLSANYRAISASSIILIRADKEDEQYTYTYFSPESRVYTPTGYHTLGDVYNYYGIDRLAEHINALTGIKPKYKLVINGYNLDELVNLLGSVTVNVSKDIYFDGYEYTTLYEQTRNAVGADGVTYVEHIPNTYVIGTGAVELNEENIYILSSLSERSMSDISMKEAYTVEAAKQYMVKLAAMEADQLKILVSQLTLNETEWVNIEGLDYQPPETEETTEETEPAEVNPWWTDQVDETGEEENPEGEETDKEEEILLFEPETPIFETTFTSADLEKIAGVLKAIPVFENITVTYPGSYVAATADSDGYFEPNLKTGIDRFLAYRKVNTETAAE